MFKSILLIIGTLAAALWYMSPILKFPEPTGNYAVGTFDMEFADASRKEIYSNNPNDNRNIVVHFYYPSSLKLRRTGPTEKNVNFEKAPYLGNKLPYFKKAVANSQHLPEFAGDILLRNIKTHSYKNAPFSSDKDKYPVVLFSHGLLGLPSDTYISILEELASHGYIVAGIDHPYFNMLTLYSDGKMASSQALSTQFEKMSQKEQREFLSHAIEIYKQDNQFIVNQFTALNENPDSIFYHHIDLDQIGIMGHSAGGTAAIETCRIDSRFKACIDLDGWYDHVIGYKPIKQPLLLLFGSKSLEVEEPTQEYLAKKELTREQYFEREQKIAEHRKALCQSPKCQFIVIPDATHGDFGDVILFKWPLRSWNAVGSYKTLQLINTKIVQFFNTYLK